MGRGTNKQRKTKSNPDAPYGYKSDGTPSKKRGRPMGSKNKTKVESEKEVTKSDTRYHN